MQAAPKSPAFPLSSQTQSPYLSERPPDGTPVSPASETDCCKRTYTYRFARARPESEIPATPSNPKTTALSLPQPAPELHPPTDSNFPPTRPLDTQPSTA